MTTRTFTTVALSFALCSSVAFAQDDAQRTATQPSQPGMSATTGATGSTGSTGASATTGAHSGTMSAHAGAAGQQAQATFTDSQTFLKQQLQANKIEKEIMELAQDKAQNESVKDLAKQQIKDHKELGDKMKDVAKEMKVEAKEQDPAMASDPTIKQLTQVRDHLKTQSGEQFDHAFLNAVANIHQQAVAQYRAASTQAQEPQMKQLAQTALPKLDQHLQSTKNAFQQVTGTAWTPSQRGFMPAATYETQPGTQSSPTHQPGSSSMGQPGSGTSGQSGAGTSGQTGSSSMGQPSQPQSGSSAQPSGQTDR